jgi:hypothetical protein
MTFLPTVIQRFMFGFELSIESHEILDIFV